MNLKTKHVMDNKLIDLHLNAIEESKEELAFDLGMSVNEELAASKSAQITEDIAIEFWVWMKHNDIPENAEKYANFTDKDMFQEFLKTKQWKII